MSGLFLMARVAEEAVAIASEQVGSVVELSAITPVPLAARHVLGLAALGSWLVTVIDTPVAIGLPCSSAAMRHAVVVAVEGHDYALVVDALADVIALDVQPLTATGGIPPVWAAVTAGAAAGEDGPILVLDPAAILNLAAQPA
jgi:purine-binding chemotaxis protein CheW